MEILGEIVRGAGCLADVLCAPRGRTAVISSSRYAFAGLLLFAAWAVAQTWRKGI